MGIGSALLEERLLDKGRMVNPNLTDYKIVSTGEMPLMENVKSVFVESAPHKDGPYGAKGMVETAMCSIAPAIANAIYNAIGVRIRGDLLTPDKILEALALDKILEVPGQEV